MNPKTRKLDDGTEVVIGSVHYTTKVEYGKNSYYVFAKTADGKEKCIFILGEEELARNVTKALNGA